MTDSSSAGPWATFSEARWFVAIARILAGKSPWETMPSSAIAAAQDWAAVIRAGDDSRGESQDASRYRFRAASIASVGPAVIQGSGPGVGEGRGLSRSRKWSTNDMDATP